MNPRFLLLGAIGISTALSLGTGCKKSSERERREAERAMVEASKQASQAEADANRKAQNAEQKAATQAAQFLAAVTREKADVGFALHRELDEIERRLSELNVDVKPETPPTYDKSSKDAKEIERLIARRETLEGDADAIGNVAPHEWPTLKARIDKDLSRWRPSLRPAIRPPPSPAPEPEPVPGT